MVYPMTGSEIDRRRFIKTGVLGTAALGLGGLGWGLSAGERAQNSESLQCLDVRAHAILAAVADRMCRAGSDGPSASDVKVVEKIDQLLASLPASAATELKQALLLLESPLFGALMEGRMRPFTRCSGDQQDRILAAWRDSRWPLRRTVYDALHALCMAPYWSDASLWDHMGYPGPPDFRPLLELDA
jgi:hypothetical protein